MAWDPTQYLTFAGPRLRPALDLIAQIPLAAPKRVVDLGCGAGNVTQVLKDRWPEAEVRGVDNSPEMLAKARAAHPTIAWEEADVGRWTPDAPYDLVFANAALQWLSDHKTLFPRVAGMVAKGGALAVQMPRNYNAPSHVMMREAAKDGPWEKKLANVRPDDPTGDPQFYYDLLSPLAASLDMWETEYCMIMEGENPVAEFTKGTWLGALLAALDEPDRTNYENAYRARILKAYPKRPDGKTLFPFRRLFIIARF